MSIAQRQLLEIIKALSLNSRLVIMDEPTSSLTLTETDRLMQVIADLKAEGVSVIFISHRLNEVEACADRVVVLRDGRVVGHLAQGRDQPRPHDPADDRPRPQSRSTCRPPRRPARRAGDRRGAHRRPIRDRSVSLTLRRGEILGLAGLVGSGRTELARAVFGIDRMLGGAIRLDGAADRRCASPSEAIARGIYLVPEDRKRSGLLLDFAITDNISLPDLPAYAQACAGQPARARRRMPRCSGDGSSIRAPERRDAGRRRCPAATSRRSCSPNGCR